MSTKDTIKMSEDKEPKINYSIFIMAMLGLLFLLSAISYMNLSRNIPDNQITDPYVRKELKHVQTLCFWIMFISAIVFIVYGYMITKNK